MKVVVGSKNPVKIECVRLAFSAVWPKKEWEVVGIESDSGVSAQPMNIEESIKGARTRARLAIENLGGDFGVGLEGGIFEVNDLHFDGGWVVVRDKNGVEGLAATPLILVPPKMMKLINEGKEMGEADDILFNRTNSKQGNGHFGLFTNDIITRTDAYKYGVIVALARFIQPEVFE